MVNHDSVVSKHYPHETMREKPKNHWLQSSRSP